MTAIQTPGVGELLTLDDYLELCRSQGPKLARRIHLRTAWGMLHDMIDSHGYSEVDYIGKKILRPKFFDGEKLGFGGYKFFGGDDMLANLARDIHSFAESRDDRMVLTLKGPPSCAKSVLRNMFKEGLIQFSREEDLGARYMHQWVLPTSTRTGVEEKSRIGFINGGRGNAQFSPLDIEGLVKEGFKTVPCQLRNSPLRIFPRQMRIDLFKDLFDIDKDDIKYDVPEVYQKDCCPNCDSVLQRLVEIYTKKNHSDIKDNTERRERAYGDALRHVVVQRYAYDQAGSGIVTIPVHGQFRSGQVVPLTDDSMYRDILGVLRNIGVRYLVFQNSSHIASANGLMSIEEMCEHPQVTSGHENDFFSKGEVDMNNISLTVDTAVIGTTNIEPYLRAKDSESTNPGAQTRWHVVDVIHPLRVPDAIELYEQSILHRSQIGGEKHVAPYAATALGMWSTLCRLESPRSILSRMEKAIEKLKDKKKGLEGFIFSEEEIDLIKELTVVDKAQLYSGRYGVVKAQVPKQLARHVTDLFVDKLHSISINEGIVLPTRALRSKIVGPALEEEGSCLLPFHILDAIEGYLSDPDKITDSIFKRDVNMYRGHFFRSLVQMKVQTKLFLRLDIEAAIAHQDDAEGQSLAALKNYVGLLGVIAAGQTMTVPDPQNPAGDEIPPQELLIPFEETLEKGGYFSEGYGEQNILHARDVIFKAFYKYVPIYQEEHGEDYQPDDDFYLSVFREVINDHLRGSMFDPLSIVLRSRDLFISAVEKADQMYDGEHFDAKLLKGENDDHAMIKARHRTATYLNTLIEMSGRPGRMDAAKYCSDCAARTMHYVLQNDLLLESVPESKRSEVEEMMNIDLK